MINRKILNIITIGLLMVGFFYPLLTPGQEKIVASNTFHIDLWYDNSGH